MNCKLKYYLVRMIAGFTAYVLAVVAAHYFYAKQSLHGFWPIFLVPVIPIIYIVASIIRYVAEGLDELQRKVVTEAAAFSGIATGFTCVSYLFFENAGAPKFHAEWAFYMMWVYYGIGAMVSSRRYR
jgi:fructose-specific phosphotransferase system IIC component